METDAVARNIIREYLTDRLDEAKRDRRFVRISVIEDLLADLVTRENV